METIHPVVCYAMRIVEEATGKYSYLQEIQVIWKVSLILRKEADLFLADTYLFEGNEHHHAHFTSKKLENWRNQLT